MICASPVVTRVEVVTTVLIGQLMSSWVASTGGSVVGFSYSRSAPVMLAVLHDFPARKEKFRLQIRIRQRDSEAEITRQVL